MRKKKVDQRRDSTDRLLAAALHLFVSQGYGATNLEKIAGAAGLTKGAVYFYFGSKESVLVEVLKQVQTVVLDGAVDAVKQAGPTGTDKIIAFLHHAANLGITHRDEVLLLILMSLEFKERDGEVLTAIDRIYLRLHSLVEELIRDGQAAGEFRQDLPARELAVIVMANHDGTFLEWYRWPEAMQDKDLVRAFRAVVVAGLHPPGGKLLGARAKTRSSGKR